MDHTLREALALLLLLLLLVVFGEGDCFLLFDAEGDACPLTFGAGDAETECVFVGDVDAEAVFVSVEETPDLVESMVLLALSFLLRREVLLLVNPGVLNANHPELLFIVCYLF
jgi:hypothetical protein